MTGTQPWRRSFKTKKNENLTQQAKAQSIQLRKRILEKRVKRKKGTKKQSWNKQVEIAGLFCDETVRLVKLLDLTFPSSPISAFCYRLGNFICCSRPGPAPADWEIFLVVCSYSWKWGVKWFQQKWPGGKLRAAASFSRGWYHTRKHCLVWKKRKEV